MLTSRVGDPYLGGFPASERVMLSDGTVRPLAEVLPSWDWYQSWWENIARAPALMGPDLEPRWITDIVVHLSPLVRIQPDGVGYSFRMSIYQSFQVRNPAGELVAANVLDLCQLQGPTMATYGYRCCEIPIRRALGGGPERYAMKKFSIFPINSGLRSTVYAFSVDGDHQFLLGDGLPCHDFTYSIERRKPWT